MAGYPAPNAVFVPSFEASGGLIIGFSRNPKKFRLNQYTKFIPVSKDVGYYLNITAEEAARVINSNLSDFVWADGQEAPMGNDNLESFNFLKYATKRYVYPFNMGHKTIAQADWPILQIHGGIAAQKAMTARTIAVQNVLTTAGNWGSNTATATSAGGGKWDVSTSALLYIKKTVDYVCEAILRRATLGVVQREDLVMVMNPHTARLAAETGEIQDYVKNNVFGLASLRQDQPGQNGQWGLPDVLYGVKVVVEDAVQLTSPKGATRATQYCMPNQNVVVLARPGELVGIEGIPEF